MTQCLIVTRTMGLAYARELAYQQPDLVLGIVALAPALSFKAVQDVEAMPAPHRFQFLAARAMPPPRSAWRGSATASFSSTTMES